MKMLHEQHKLGGAFAWWVWALGVAFVVFLFSIQTGYAIVNPLLRKSLSLSFAEIGLIAALYTWVFAICQFLSGALLDLFGARKVLTTSVMLVTVGVFIFAFSDSFFGILLAQFFLAVGSCSGFVGAGFVGAQWFGPGKFSFMFGLAQLFVALSSAFTQNIFNITLNFISWRTLYVGMGIFGVFLIILYLFFMRDHQLYRSQKQSSGTLFLKDFYEDLISVAKVPHVWAAAIGGGMTFAVTLALGVVWAPKMMLAHAISQEDANFATSMVWLGLAICSPLITYLSDKFNDRKWLILIGTVIQLSCLLLVLFLPTHNLLLLMLLLFIFGVCSAAHMLAFTTAADVLPEKYVGTASAIVNGFMFISGGIMISLPGKLIDVSSNWTMHAIQKAFVPLIIGLVVAILVALIMKNTHPAMKATRQ